MTTEQIEARIPALLEILRSVPLSPELEEVREHVFSSTWPDATTEPTTTGSLFHFRPVPIRGEPGSVTLLRDRGDY